MKQLIFLIFIGMLFIRSGCKKKCVMHCSITAKYTLENGLDKSIRLRFDWYNQPSELIGLTPNEQFTGSGKINTRSTWTEGYYFHAASSEILYVEDKSINIRLKWKLLQTDADDVEHYYYRITSADTVLVKKPVSKEQPAAATATSSGTPAS